MTTQESNKLIDDFTKLKEIRISNTYIENLEGLRKKYPNDYVKYLQYDSNWSWLMPVVEKIASESMYYLTFDDDKGTFWKNYQTKLQACKTGNLEVVYEAVVEFIIWYNNMKTLENDIN